MRFRTAAAFALLLAVALIGATAVLAPHVAHAQAQNSPCGGNTRFEAFAFETITVSTTAVGFTSATYAPSGTTPADYAMVSVETAAIRYRVDGVAPTASVGHAIEAGSGFPVCGQPSLKTFQMIRRDGADSTVRVTYYRGAK